MRSAAVRAPGQASVAVTCGLDLATRRGAASVARAGLCFKGVAGMSTWVHGLLIPVFYWAQRVLARTFTLISRQRPLFVARRHGATIPRIMNTSCFFAQTTVCAT